MKKYVLRRLSVFVVALAGILFIVLQTDLPKEVEYKQDLHGYTSYVSASEKLEQLPIKGRAPKTGYSRDQFGSGWEKISGCTIRNIILNRDLTDVSLDEDCNVLSGVLQDPYTGTTIRFDRGNSGSVQIDHVVALSDSWQKGAQQLTSDQRRQLANDPLNLLAVDGEANRQKGDGDAATWLPPNKSFRCQYIARQIEVKSKYHLWVTDAENKTMAKIISNC